MLALRRIAATPSRLPAAVAARQYTTGRTEGSVAESKGFNKKERAHEDEYVHRHEAALLKKMKADIEAKKAELSRLEKEHAELAEKNQKQ